MARFGKPDATGRSSGKLAGRQGKLRRPPEGESWVWLLRDLLASPAWRAQSIHCRRLVDFLLIEYLNHAGTENGNLKATYRQLRESGISGRFIPGAIREAEELGLVRCEHGGRWTMTNQPNIFSLTFYPDNRENCATNDWKGITDENVEAWKKRRKKQNRPTQTGTTVIPPYGTTARTIPK